MSASRDIRAGARNLLINCAELSGAESLLIVREDPGLGWYDGQTAADYAIRKNRKDLADEIKRHMEAAANGPVIQEAKPDPFAGHEEEID